MKELRQTRGGEMHNKVFNMHFIILLCMSLCVYCVFFMINSNMTDYCTTKLGMTVSMAHVVTGIEGV